LCNAVDEPERCDFYYPAVVRRGDLQIAISTAGRSPALAQRLRRELEVQFGPQYESFLNQLGHQRRKLLSDSDGERKRRRTHALASRQAFERFTSGSAFRKAGGRLK
jgi:precorrin-2 dehydrogenase/sirohydrochlorin ferrochelatase